MGGRRWRLSQNPRLHGVSGSLQRQVLRKIKGGGCGRDRLHDRLSLQALLGCLGSRIGPQE